MITDDLIRPGVPGGVLTVDLNNSMARSGHAFAALTGPDGRPSGALFGTLKEIHKVACRGKYKAILLCKDRGRPAFRVEAINKHAAEGNGYKAHRKEKRDKKAEIIHENYVAQLEYCHRLFMPFGLHVIGAQDFEADDVISSLVYRYPEEKFTILSGDHDLWQLILKGARVIDPKSWDYVETPHEAYVLGRAIGGDKSDNIPGVRGVGEKTFYKLVTKYGLEGINTPKKFCKALARKIKTDPKAPLACSKIVAGKEILVDYYRATHLKNVVDAIDSIEIYEGAWLDERATKMCKKFGFKSILMEWQSFSRTFRDTAARISV